MLRNIIPTTDLSKLERIGIAIKNVGRNQNHVGLIFENEIDEGQSPALLHLGFPRGMFIEPANDEYLYINFCEYFSEYDREIILAHIYKVILVNSPYQAPLGNSSFPMYGLDTETNYFNRESGKFEKALQPVGLTCATFVLEILASCGYELLDLNNWPRNVKINEEWQDKIIRALSMEKFGIPADFLTAQNRNKGNKRFLPEEVAAATQHGPHPLKRKQLKTTAKKIRNKLTAAL
jgi:hypothetical protein